MNSVKEPEVELSESSLDVWTPVSTNDVVVDAINGVVWVEVLGLMLVEYILDVASLEVNAEEIDAELDELGTAAITTVSERVDTMYELSDLSRLLLSDVDAEAAVDEATNNSDVVGDDTTGISVEVNEANALAPQETS